MTNEHRARELAAKLVDNIECNIDLVNGTGDTSIKDGESLILRAFESVQAETERRTLERAAMAAPVLPSNWADWPSDRAIAFVRGWKAKHAAILALIAEPAPPDPLLVALAGLFADNWREIPLRMLIKAGLVDADYHAKLTELGKAAIAIAEGNQCLS